MGWYEVEALNLPPGLVSLAGYVFGDVCLSVGRITQKTTESISLKLGGRMGRRPGKNPFN